MKRVGIVGLSLGAVAAAAALTLQPLRIVSAGGGVAQALTTVTLYNSAYYRGIGGKDIIHIGSGDATGFHVQWNNGSLSGFNTNAVTFQELWVTADSNPGVQVKWAGSTTRTFSAGEVDVLSDWISAADLGFAGGTIPRGTTIRVGSRAEVAGNTDKLPLHNDNNPSNTSALFYVPGAGTVGGLSGTGGLTFSGSVIPATTALTFNLVGRFASGDPYVFAGVGDSITWGANDSLSGSTNYTPGWFKRSLYDDWTNKTGVRAGVQIARYGSTAAVWAASNTENRAVIAAVLKYCNFLLDRYGTNNIQAAGGQPEADAIIAERKTNIWDWYKSTVGPTNGRSLKVAAFGLFPKVTGTYTTLAGQTPKAGCALGGTMDLLDTKLATIAGTAAGPDYFVPVTTAVRGSATKTDADYWKWAVSPGPTTDDGTHPIILGHDLEATNARTFYATIAA